MSTFPSAKKTGRASGAGVIASGPSRRGQQRVHVSPAKVLRGLATVVILLSPISLRAQSEPDQNFQIDFPAEYPVSVVGMDWGSSQATPRGGAMVLDLHTSLKLRNTGQKHIRGITLLVLAQEVTPGGKASVSVPSLNVAPGETFPVRVDLRLLRPLGAGPLVKVALDGLLFDDLTFAGPNRLKSRRSMMIWEMQARRDREHFKRILAESGPEGLQEEVLASVARQAERPRVNVQVAWRGRATNLESGQDYRIAFLSFPGAPVEPLSGTARMVGREAHGPSFEIRNRSAREVRHLEIGWIFRDMNGQEFQAGTVPAELDLAPGSRSQITTDRVLRFSRPLMVEGMRGYVSHVEFADGEVWIPTRADLSEQRLEALTGPSPEEQRLTNLYRKKGLRALVDELEKF